MRCGFFSIIAVSDAVTTGETCRSISPLSGSTSGRSRYGFGAGGEASFFFINPSFVHGSPSERIDHLFHTCKVIDQEIRVILGKPLAHAWDGRQRAGARP